MDVARSNYAFNSGAAILMMVFQVILQITQNRDERISDPLCRIFQFVKENSAVHRKITECLMSQKDDLLKDMLCVVAHGTPAARAPAADLLFYYWPSLNPTHYDRRNVLSKFNSR